MGAIYFKSCPCARHSDPLREFRTIQFKRNQDTLMATYMLHEQHVVQLQNALGSYFFSHLNCLFLEIFYLFFLFVLHALVCF